MEVAPDEKFCRSFVNYTHDSEDEDENGGTRGKREHIHLVTDKDNTYVRITRTGRWKIS